MSVDVGRREGGGVCVGMGRWDEGREVGCHGGGLRYHLGWRRWAGGADSLCY